MIITGSQGFIGSALAKKVPFRGEVPDRDSEVVFYFGAPSSVIQFNKNLNYCVKETVSGFLELISYCADNGIYFVYPSSATVYNKNNSYAHTKAALEELAGAFNCKSLGLRISAGYGPGEGEKGECASVIYQWCQEMKQGRSPMIYGDGTQTRDFVYIDDITDQILELVKKKETGIKNICTGINTSFNDIVQIINEELGTQIKPVYVDKPKSYIQETRCTPSFASKVDIRKGIRNILQNI